MKKIAAVFLSAFTFCSYGFAQKHIEHVNQAWAAYLNQTRLSDRWGFTADFHLRTREDFFSQVSTTITRAGITYYATDDLRFTAGYGYVNHFNNGVRQWEHRPWQQVQLNSKINRLSFSQYLRFEERYRKRITAGYDFNYRLRYNALLMVPLSQRAFAPGTFSVALNDELHVNMGKQVIRNYFDQNRFFIGFAYHLKPKSVVQFGYLSVFSQLSSGNQYKSVHAPRVYFYHNLDLRKNKGI
jgi:hypothetical protein